MLIIETRDKAVFPCVGFATNEDSDTSLVLHLSFTPQRSIAETFETAAEALEVYEDLKAAVVNGAYFYSIPERKAYLHPRDAVFDIDTDAIVEACMEDVEETLRRMTGE